MSNLGIGDPEAVPDVAPNGSVVGRTVQAVEIADVPGEEAPFVAVFDGLGTGILGDDDLAAAGEALEVDTRAIMLVYENAWAAPFAVAVRESGGTLVDHGRIPIQSVIAALDELEAADTA